MNENAIKNFSLARARGLSAYALALALMAAVLVPLAVFGADAGKKQVRDWTKELSDRDAHKRRKAAAEAGRLRDKGAAAALRAALRDADPVVRREAAAAAGMAGDAGAVPVLMRVLGDTEASVRYAAIRSLGLLRAPGAVAALTTAAGSDDPGVRALALDALARIGSEEALEGVFRAVRGDAVSAADACRALQWAPQGAGDSLLEAALKRPEEQVQAAAAFALARGGRGDLARGPAIGLLLSSDPAVRAEAAQAAGLAGGPEARAALARALEIERDAWVRSVFETALGGRP